MHMNPGIDELQSILVFDQDRHRRALAHLQLGRLAVQDERNELAGRHFREALVLDARLDRARRFLGELGQDRPVQGVPGRLRRLLERFRK